MPLPAGKAIVGMVHVRALPATPHHELPVSQIVQTAAQEARTLAAAGCDAVIMENMHDRPYLLGEVGPEVVAGMTVAAAAVRETVSIPIGIQILAGANREALAVAHAAKADFIRAENFVFAHVADEGLMATADAGRLLRYRREISAEHIAILADVKKKHASHSITADTDLAETARAAEFFGADGIVITGTATGRPADPRDVRLAAEAVSIPVAVGSGLTPDNLADYWPHADLLIVGSFIKRDGVWSNPIDAARLTAFLQAANRLKST
jgi:membrane complex biogenesis BtpA family protein